MWGRLLGPSGGASEEDEPGGVGYHDPVEHVGAGCLPQHHGAARSRHAPRRLFKNHPPPRARFVAPSKDALWRGASASAVHKANVAPDSGVLPEKNGAVWLHSAVCGRRQLPTRARHTHTRKHVRKPRLRERGRPASTVPLHVGSFFEFPPEPVAPNARCAPGHVLSRKQSRIRRLVPCVAPDFLHCLPHKDPPGRRDGGKPYRGGGSAVSASWHLSLARLALFECSCTLQQQERMWWRCAGGGGVAEGRA